MRKLSGIGLLALCMMIAPAVAQEEVSKEFLLNELSVSKSRSSNGMHVLRYKTGNDKLVINDIIVNKGRCHTVFTKYPLLAAINTTIEVYVNCEPFSVKTTTVNKDYLNVFNNY